LTPCPFVARKEIPQVFLNGPTRNIPYAHQSIVLMPFELSKDFFYFKKKLKLNNRMHLILIILLNLLHP